MLSKPNQSLEASDLDDMLTVLRKPTTDFQSLTECYCTISFDTSHCFVSQDKCSTESVDESSFSGIAYAMVTAA